MTINLGWPHASCAQPWSEIEQSFAELEEWNAAFASLRAIAASVRDVGAQDDLTGFTAMHGMDLMVRSTPVPPPPYDVVAVRINESLRQVRAGTVLIEHLHDRTRRAHNEAGRGSRPAVLALYDREVWRRSHRTATSPT